MISEGPRQQPSSVTRHERVESVRHAGREAGARFCIHCGHPFPPSKPIGLRCPACHSINLLGEAVLRRVWRTPCP